VESHNNVLQPIEIPTAEEPFSVYPISHCVSEVGKIEEHDVMKLFDIGHVLLEVPVGVSAKDSDVLACDTSGYLY
jgi:hypothetical protein